jgi:hypothetical protein
LRTRGLKKSCRPRKLATRGRKFQEEPRGPETYCGKLIKSGSLERWQRPRSIAEGQVLAGCLGSQYDAGKVCSSRVFSWKAPSPGCFKAGQKGPVRVHAGQCASRARVGIQGLKKVDTSPLSVIREELGAGPSEFKKW